METSCGEWILKFRNKEVAVGDFDGVRRSADAIVASGSLPQNSEWAVNSRGTFHSLWHLYGRVIGGKHEAESRRLGANGTLTAKMSPSADWLNTGSLPVLAQ